MWPFPCYMPGPLVHKQYTESVFLWSGGFIVRECQIWPFLETLNINETLYEWKCASQSLAHSFTWYERHLKDRITWTALLFKTWALYHLTSYEFILMGEGLLRKPLRKMGMYGGRHQSNLSGLELALKGTSGKGSLEGGNRPEEVSLCVISSFLALG